MRIEKKAVPKPKKSYKGHSKKYPMLAFRIPTWTQEEGALKRIEANIERLYEHFKDVKSERSKVVNRNDIVFEAMDIGLITLRKIQKV